MLGNMKEDYAIKFCVKLKKTKLEAYEMLNEAYGDEQMSQASFGDLTDFLKEMNRLKMNQDMEHQKVQDQMVSEAVIISIGTVDTILTEDLKLHKVCAKFVSKILSNDQRQLCME